MTADTAVLEKTFTLPQLTPGHLHVIKRDGSVVPFDPQEIHDAITEAFKAVHGAGFVDSRSGPEIIRMLTSQIVEALVRRKDFGTTIDLEDIQDQVELALMRSGEHKVARAYVIYREDRRKAREKRSKKNSAQAGLYSCEAR